jgi:hypothetical protein
MARIIENSLACLICFISWDLEIEGLKDIVSIMELALHRHTVTGYLPGKHMIKG